MSDFELLRFVQAPRGAVWRAFADVDLFNVWFWPPSLSPLTVLDFRQGGSWRVTSSVAEMGVGGEYGEIIDEQQLEFTWRWDGETTVTQVTVRFDDDGDQAMTVRVEHSGFDDDDRAVQHEQGWSESLDRLLGVCGR
jgi:uncharacterized protein YndB with AHSA1/START domain